jgi:tight adherence protein C
MVGLTARLLIHAAVLPRVQLALHLRHIEGYGFDQATAQVDEDSRAQLNRSIVKLVERIGAFVMDVLPQAVPVQRKELTAAGYYDQSPELVHGYRVLAVVWLPLLMLGFISAAGAGMGMIEMVMVGGCAAGGWILPAVVIRKKGASRMDEVDHELPELIDLLIATVEAGMGVGGSLGLVANRFEGPLGDELRLTLQQQKLGVSNEQALNDMVERCDTPSMRAFVRTVTRSEQMGGSVGPVLRELAHDQRRRRRQSASEKIQKAPVKMLFPLMFMIFPALLIELMFPAAYSLLHNLAAGGL